jgi:Caspase domain
MTSLPVTRPAPELPAGPRAALVIAIGNYTDAALTRLDATARDAAEMADVLGNPDIGSFEVTALVDRTAQEIRLALEDFLEGRGREDLVVVYLSCHGLLDRQDRLYFAATDTRRDRLAATGVEAQWLWDRLEECRATCQVVILDCCNSGAFGRAGAKGEADADLRLPERFITQGRGRAVLTASRANQRSWESDPTGGAAGPSVFTSALVEGLRTGAADADGDGYVSVDDAYSYAYRKVMDSGAGQVPQRSMSTGEGIMLLARNPAGLIITPAPLTEYLRTALDSPSPAIRLAAVNDLGDWLTGTDPARALAAEQTLRRIATTEVFAVADVARAHLNAREARADAGQQAEEPAPREARADAGQQAEEPAPREARGYVPERAGSAAETTPLLAHEASSAAARLLAAGSFILIIPLFISALDILVGLRSGTLWPWWIVAAASILGIAVTLGGIGQNAVFASIVLWNLAWFLVYSLSILAFIHSTYSGTPNIFLAECIIGAVGNAALCAWILTLRFRGTPRVDPFMAIFTGCFSVGLVLVAIAWKTEIGIAFATGKLAVWYAAGWVAIIAALILLLASIRALRPGATNS